MECEEHKRFVKYLNEKHLKNEEFKGQLQDVVKLHEEIGTLKFTLAKFVNGTKNLDKSLLRNLAPHFNPKPQVYGSSHHLYGAQLFHLYSM